MRKLTSPIQGSRTWKPFDISHPLVHKRRYWTFWPQPRPCLAQHLLQKKGNNIHLSKLNFGIMVRPKRSKMQLFFSSFQSLPACDWGGAVGANGVDKLVWESEKTQKAECKPTDPNHSKVREPHWPTHATIPHAPMGLFRKVVHEVYCGLSFMTTQNNLQQYQQILNNYYNYWETKFKGEINCSNEYGFSRCMYNLMMDPDRYYTDLKLRMIQRKENRKVGWIKRNYLKRKFSKKKAKEEGHFVF